MCLNESFIHSNAWSWSGLNSGRRTEIHAGSVNIWGQLKSSQPLACMWMLCVANHPDDCHPWKALKRLTSDIPSHLNLMRNPSQINVYTKRLFRQLAMIFAKTGDLNIMLSVADPIRTSSPEKYWLKSVKSPLPQIVMILFRIWDIVLLAKLLVKLFGVRLESNKKCMSGSNCLIDS